MTDRNDAFRRKCAEIDGSYKTNIPVKEYYYDDQQIVTRCSRLDELPTYDNDAEIDPVVRLLDGKQFELYYACLIVEVVDCSLILKATSAQKREALMRVLIGDEK